MRTSVSVYYVILFSLGIILGNPTSSDDSLYSQLELPSLDVRKTTTSSGPEASVTIHKENWHATGKSLADIIQEYSGIQTRKYGGLGSFQTVSIRGVPGSKVKVFLDDTPLNSAGGGAVDLGKINLASIEKIIVYKGFIPSQFGGNSLGGVIHLITKSEGRTKFSLESSYGSFNTLKLQGNLIIPIVKIINFSSRLNYANSDNDFKYLDRNNTPYNDDDDTLRLLENSSFSNLEGNHRLNLYLKNHQTHIQFFHSNPEGGIPGQEGHITKTAGFKNPTYTISGLYHNNAWENQDVNFKLSGSFKEEKPRYFWTDQDNLTWASSGTGTDIGSLNRGYNGSLFSTLDKAGLMVLDLGIIGDYQTLEPLVFDEHSATNFWKNNRTSHAIVGELNSKIFSPNNSVTLGYRIERVENHSEAGNEINGIDYLPSNNFDLHQSFRGGTNWTFGNKTKSIKLFANVGRYYQLPSLTELYGGKWGLLPNPELISETGLNMELGLATSWLYKNKLQFSELVYFQNINENSIYYIRSAQLLKPLNINSSRTRGIELSINLLYKKIAIDNFLTFQHSVNTSELFYEGNRVPNQPVFSSISHFNLFLSENIKTVWTMDFNSPLYRDQGNLQKIPSQLLHHVKIQLMFSSKVQFNYSMENITDEFYENAYSSFPYPGRQMHFSFNFKY